MIEFDEMAEEKGGVSWFGAVISVESRLDITWDDYEFSDYDNTTRRYHGLNEEVIDWLNEHVGGDDWSIDTDTQAATLSLYLLGHHNVVAFQMRWG